MPTLERLRQVIARVPRGKVITYGQVAAAAGVPGAARLTVWALRGPGQLPWHRVVGAGGRIALGGEDGAEQRLRLEIEGVTFRAGRVRMERHNWIPSSQRATSRRREGRTSSRPGTRATASKRTPSRAARAPRSRGSRTGRSPSRPALPRRRRVKLL